MYMEISYVRGNKSRVVEYYFELSYLINQLTLFKVHTWLISSRISIKKTHLYQNKETHRLSRLSRLSSTKVHTNEIHIYLAYYLRITLFRSLRTHVARLPSFVPSKCIIKFRPVSFEGTSKQQAGSNNAAIILKFVRLV